MTNSFAYESDWRNYVYGPQKARFARKKELQGKFLQVNLKDGTKLNEQGQWVPLQPGDGGIPVISDGENATIINNEDMTMVFGGTGSGKTRCLASELICTLAKAGESMVIMDQKGSFSAGKELAPYVRHCLEQEGYECRFLNFKDLNGDSFNMLGKIYRCWRKGDYETAGLETDKLLEQLDDNKSVNGREWQKWGLTYLRGVIELLCAVAPEQAVNFANINKFCGEKVAKEFYWLLEKHALPMSTIGMERTLSVMPKYRNGFNSILLSASEYTEKFLKNNRLLKMVSNTTFEVADLYRKKMAIFIILPEDQVYNSIAGILMGQIADTLVDAAYRNKENTLPRRVNFVADEFANYRINNMNVRIATDRSKNIRWYLFSQGMEQLNVLYKKEADTILANCSNRFFLSSPEYKLMTRLSEESGVRMDNPGENQEPLITYQDLKSLAKGRDSREVYYSCRDISYVSELPDISRYTCLKGKQEDYDLPTCKEREVLDFNWDDFVDRVLELHSLNRRQMENAIEDMF